MTNSKLKKMSVLLGVSAIALSTLSAEPNVSGYSYIQATSEFTGTSSSDVDVTPYSETSVVLEDTSESGASFYMENLFVFDGSSDVDYSIDNAYLRYDAEADEFGNNYGMQIGLDYMSFAGAYNYTAGDLLQDGTEDWSETWNLQLEAPVVSNEDGVLTVVPFAVFDFDNTANAGAGVKANYSLTDSALSDVEGTFYYDMTNDYAKVGAGLDYSLGFDFGLAGNLNVSETSDFEVSGYVTTTMDKTTLTLDALYDNDSYYSIMPEVDYALSDATTLTAYTEVSVDTTDNNSVSYDAEVYATCYLADDLYVRPYLISDFDSSVSLELEVYKSF